MEEKSSSPKHEPIEIAQPIFVVPLTDEVSYAPGGETVASTTSSERNYIDERNILILEDEDILCGNGQGDHPGNVTMNDIIQRFAEDYGWDSTVEARNDLLTKMRLVIETVQREAQQKAPQANNDPYRRPPQFVVFQWASRGKICCRAASVEEVRRELEQGILWHFRIVRPEEDDVILGEDPKDRYLDTIHVGNKKLWQYMEAQLELHPDSGKITNLARGVVKGRFLLQLDTGNGQRVFCQAFDDRKINERFRLWCLELGMRPSTSRAQSRYVPAAQDRLRSSDGSAWTREHIPESHDHPFATATPIQDPSPETERARDQEERAREQEEQAREQEERAREQKDESPRCSFFFARPKTLVASSFLLLAAIVIAITIPLTKNDNTDAPTASPIETPPPSSPGTLPFLQEIWVREKKKLVCGVTNQVGYSTKNDLSGVWEGFEVDICRSIAAAIFGKAQFLESGSNRASEPVEFVSLNPDERFLALNNKTIDLLLASTSQTMERNVYEPTTKTGYTFSTPYLVNQVTLAGDPEFFDCFENFDTNSSSFDHCDQLRVCFLEGTTHQYILEQLLADRDFTRYASPANSLDDFYSDFADGYCNVLIGEKIDLALRNVQLKGYVGDYDFHDKVFGNEYISLVTRDGDPEFSDFCNWIIQALFSAEELRLAGMSYLDIPIPNAFGDRYSTMIQDAVGAVGDYGQLYDLHLEDFVERPPANQINVGNKPGMYAIPFGDTDRAQEIAPDMTDSTTIQEIKDSDKLRCGVLKSPIFSEENEEYEDVLVGLDADFCRGLAAALFDGQTGKVSFVPLRTSERFKALQSGRVDVLASVTTITLERDVKEPGTEAGFVYAFPNFHDGIRFAGEPDFVDCAERRDTSGNCSVLSICVTQNTTQSVLVRKVLPDAFIVETASTSQNAEWLGINRCKVLAGGAVDTSNSNIREWYSGELSLSDPISRESLALVTRQDDPLWSKLVNWVVMSTLIAEQNNITQETYRQMPRVNWFGPMVGDEFLRYVIREIGSYAEIWNRSATPAGLVRQDRNLLDSDHTSALLRSDLLLNIP